MVADVIRLIVAALLCMMISTTPLHAQRAPEASVAFRNDTISQHPNSQGPKRFLGATAGAVLGIIFGAYAGYNVLPHNCGCDDPGLDEIVYGGLVGAAVGAAVGASAPDLHSACSFDARLGRSLIGSVGVAAASWFVAGGANGGAIIAVPVGAIGGSLAGLGRCWQSR
jgi:hypothetical protein